MSYRTNDALHTVALVSIGVFGAAVGVLAVLSWQHIALVSETPWVAVPLCLIVSAAALCMLGLSVWGLVDVARTRRAE